MIAERLGRALGVPVVVDNRPGARPLGPASVVEFVDRPRSPQRPGICAVCPHCTASWDAVRHRGAIATCLIEINRRMLPATHGGALVGIDLAAALFAAAHGREWAGLPPGPEARLALFPQEWYRDDESAWVRRLPSDAPWHDPALLAAMVRMPLEAGRSPSPSIFPPLL